MVLLLERLAPLALPVSAFLFRPWEYITGSYRYNRAHTDQTLSLTGYGDLSNMLGVRSYRVYRPYVWTNDEYGFRNDPTTRHEHPDIVVVGDSFMAGAAGPDAETFAHVLQAQTERSVYAYVPSNLSSFLKDPRFRASPPALVIWGRVERNLSGDNGEIDMLAADVTCFQDTLSLRRHIEDAKTLVKRAIGGFVEYANLSLGRRIARPLLAEAIFDLTGRQHDDVVIGPHASHMLFFARTIHLLDVPASERLYDRTLAAVLHVSDCLARRGTRLVFLPIPDKEHVYAEILGESPPHPDPLEELLALTRDQGILGVSLSPLFQAHARSGSLLYWPDDTHWNGDGVRLAVTQTLQVLP